MMETQDKKHEASGVSDTAEEKHVAEKASHASPAAKAAHHEHNVPHKQKDNTNYLWPGISAALFLILLIFLVTASGQNNQPAVKPLDKQGFSLHMKNFIQESMMHNAAQIAVENVTDEKGLYKFSVLVDGKFAGTSYATQDGALLMLPNGVIDVEEFKKQLKEQENNPQENTPEPPPKLTKSDTPNIELFVMSYCPYGLQIEKGILPVLDTLGSKAKFGLKFVDYAMHGEKEIDENIRQYCIEKEEPSKFNKYLRCFIKEGKSADCLKSESIDTVKINACFNATDAKFKIKEKLNDKSAWIGNYPPFDLNKEDTVKYGVRGSPTLVINGAQVSVSRDSATLLKTVCTAFNNPPQECNKTLSNSLPSPGFGWNEESAGSDAGAPQAGCGG